MARQKQRKSVDERLREFERELKRLDQRLEEQSGGIKEDLQDLETSFKKFLEEENIDVDELRGRIEKEMERLKKELDFTAKALRDSFNYFRAQYRKRKD